MADVDPFAVRSPRPGIETWRNPGNGLAVLQIHYTADPRKRDPDWQHKTFRGMTPRARKREYEIDWSAPEGEPVIPEYDPKIHRRVCEVDPQLRLLRGWDFGFDSPVVLFGQLSLHGQLRILDELCPFNTSLASLVPMTKAKTLQLLGSQALGRDEDDLDLGGSDEMLELFGLRPENLPSPVMDAGDPAGAHRTSLGAEIEVLSALGIQIHTIRPGTEESYEHLRGRLQKQIFTPERGYEPAFVVHPRCQNLHTALAGGFSRSPNAPYKPVKSHPAKDLVDALRYLNDNLDQMSQTVDAKMRAMALADVKELRSLPNGW